MPIYEYLCQKCGEFEVTQKITDSPLKKCPTCRSRVTKLISNTSFQLKGSGWYVTDYGRSGSKDKKSGDGEGSKESTSTESKSKEAKGSSGGESKGKKKEQAAA